MGVVVTGGAGFIGHHLVAALARSTANDLGEPIVVLDNLHRGQPRALAPWIASGAVRFIQGDLRDPRAVAEALVGASVVYHLAAQANVVGSETDPDYAFTTNVVGTEILLRAASAAGVRRVVFASSREVYGQPQALPVPETAPLAPRNTYGASKAAGEMLARAAATGGLEIVALRLANVYGPGDTGRVLPLWLDRAAHGEELLIYGGRQVLDLVWVGDVVQAMLRAARIAPAVLAAADGVESAPASRGGFAPINVGTGRGTAIHELAEHVRAAVRCEVPIRVAPARAIEVERYIADVTRLRETLGVVPEPPLAHLPEMARAALDAARQERDSATPTPLTPAAPATEREAFFVVGERVR